MAKIAQAKVRRIAADLVAAAASREAELRRLLAGAASDHGGRLVDGPHVASRGQVRRTLEAKLASDRFLASEDAAGTVLDALEAAVIVSDEAYGDAVGDVAARLGEAGCDVLQVNNYIDWPTSSGIDLLVACGAPGAHGPDSTAPGTPGAFKMRLRCHTAETWSELQSFNTLYESIRALRHGAERVGKDFSEAGPVEMWWFADVYDDLGYSLDQPAGLYVMLTTDEAQVALCLDATGWRPSTDVELWIANAEPSVTPIDDQMAAAVLAAWGVEESLAAVVTEAG